MGPSHRIGAAHQGLGHAARPTPSRPELRRKLARERVRQAATMPGVSAVVFERCVMQQPEVKRLPSARQWISARRQSPQIHPGPAGQEEQHPRIQQEQARLDTKRRIDKHFAGHCWDLHPVHWDSRVRPCVALQSLGEASQNQMRALWCSEGRMASNHRLTSSMLTCAIRLTLKPGSFRQTIRIFPLARRT